MGSECSDCRGAYEEVRKLEERQDKFHSEYLGKVHEYELDKVKDRATLEAVHKRLDNMVSLNQSMVNDHKALSTVFATHMKEEGEQHQQTNLMLGKIGIALEHLVPKEDLEVERGRITLGFRLGIFAFSIVSIFGSALLWYIKEDIKTHTTKSSVINHKSTKETIKEEITNIQNPTNKGSRYDN